MLRLASRSLPSYWLRACSNALPAAEKAVSRNSDPCIGCSSLLPPLSLLHGFSATVVEPTPSSSTQDFDLITPDQGLARIEGLDDTGFMLNGGVRLEGAIVVVGGMCALWKVGRVADITMDSLALVRLLRPVPDLIVLGCGSTLQQLPASLAQKLHQMGIRIDAMDTANAVATFNLLSIEGRSCVLFSLPPVSPP